MNSAEMLFISILIIVSVLVLIKLTSGIEKIFFGLFRRRKDDDRRDATRVYTSAQKTMASRSCNNRCEGTGLFFRCRHKGNDLHGDHWYPHSRGGATSMRNLVMLCPKCNRSKSDKIPSHLQTTALVIRRRIGLGYSNPDHKVGEWLPRSYRREISAKPDPKDYQWDL